MAYVVQSPVQRDIDSVCVSVTTPDLRTGDACVGAGVWKRSLARTLKDAQVTVLMILIVCMGKIVFLMRENYIYSWRSIKKNMFVRKQIMHTINFRGFL